MDLLDRYLQAVKFWLPDPQKEDIVAELSEDIRAQIEDKEAALGRPITEAEVVVILRQLGRPVLVANRYLPQRYLIGPLWFPIYVFVLKIVAACYLVPSILVRVGLTVFNPVYRADHPGAGWFRVLGSAWGDFWLTTMLVLGSVTVVFAALEAQAKSGFLENWDPATLPAVRDPRRIPRSGSTIELAVNIVFASWWITAMRSPIALDRPNVQIMFAPIWNTFFLGFLLLSVINVAVAAGNLLRPYWTRPRAALRLATNLLGSALFIGLCRSNIVASLTVSGVAPAETLRIVATLNRVMSQVWPIALVVGIVVLAVDVHRFVRATAAGRPLAGGVPQGGLPTSAAR
jgi:hypothetical protein